MGLSFRGRVLLVLTVIGVVWLITLSTLTSSEAERPAGAKQPLVCNKTSLVYTWVNGSDPEHIRARTERSGSSMFSSPQNNRFRDLGGLMYSLRSAEKYAPWIKDIFIVTSGQVPSFLDLTNPMIHIVAHSQIFPTASDLPTFSSNAIESSFHNLPESVGDCFIYLNDDMFFSNDVALSDFWDPVNGQILFKSTWTAPPPASRMSNTWHKSIHYTNQLLNGLWGSATRNYASHGPYFFSMTVLRHMYSALPYEFNLTTSHPFRHEKDVSIPFLYNQFALHYYQSVVAPNTINLYVKMTDDHKKMQHEFERLLSKRPKTFALMMH